MTRALTIGCLTMLIWSRLSAQDNYEYKVYGAKTLGRDTSLLELFSNFSIVGAPASGDTFSTNGMDRETVALTHGFSSWFELGAYLLNSIADQGRAGVVGGQLQPRFMIPDRWHWPVGLGLALKGGYMRMGYGPDTWSVEMRPILDKQAGRFYFSVNPTLYRSFHGANDGRGFIFAPAAKVDLKFGRWAPGLEYYGDFGPLSGFYYPPDDQQHQVFLTIDGYFNPRWEFNAGYGDGLTRSSDRSLVKLTVGRRF